MMSLIARDEEIKTLTQLFNSNKPEFLALYGRRRVGKTYLIRQFFKKKKDAIFFNVTGSKKGSIEEQINHFTDQLGEVFYEGANLNRGKNWDETFKALTKAIKNAPKGKKIILFFDELPWMATRNSRLLEALDYYWNQHWSNDKRIKLIICGSSASWIINKIIKNKGGLHNRITRKIYLEPFNLSETKSFLYKNGIKLNNKQILQIFMVTGGVPYYLSQIEKGLSATQNIEKLAFSKKAFLLDEFDNLFSSLFDDGDVHIKIVKIIAKNRYGIGKRKLLEAIGKEAVGSSGSKKLKELEETGFIISFKPLYHKRKGIYYRLVDEFSLFYLKWIDPIVDLLQKKALDHGNWQAMQTTPEWYSWQGYAFEMVCYKHLSEIRKALNVSPTAIASSWRYVPSKRSEQRGAQIDLLFDRKDDSITLCEIKYADEPFVLTKEYVNALKRKIEVFKNVTRTKKQLFLSLISANGLKENYYADDLVSGVATLEDLFKE